MNTEPTNNLNSKLYCYRRNYLKQILSEKDKYTLIKDNLRIYNLFSSTTPLTIPPLSYPNIKFANGTLTTDFKAPSVGYYGEISPTPLLVPYKISFTIHLSNSGGASADSYVNLGVFNNSSFTNTSANQSYPDLSNGNVVAIGRRYTTNPILPVTLVEDRILPNNNVYNSQINNSNYPTENCIFTLQELFQGQMQYNIYDPSVSTYTSQLFTSLWDPLLPQFQKYLFWGNSTPAVNPIFTFTMVASPF